MAQVPLSVPANLIAYPDGGVTEHHPVGTTPPIGFEGGAQAVNRGVHLMARLRFTSDLQAQVTNPEHSSGSPGQVDAGY